MEKKKLLLVAISVGVFLTIVIGAAILVFSPKSSGASAPGGSVSIGNRPLYGNSTPVETAALAPAEPIAAGTGAQAAVTETPADSRTSPFTIDAAEYVRNPEVQGIQTPTSATAIQETYFYINGVRSTESYRFETKDGDGTARVTINFPPAAAAAAPHTPSENRPAAKPAAPAASAKPDTPAAQPAATAKPVAPPSQPAAAKPAAQPAATAKPASAKAAEQTKPPAQAKTYTDYWVQTGAFSAKANAEGVKETLATRGITSIIENRDVNGKTLYQVRVGPYTSENEAKYWLALVQSIDGFSESQIRQSSSVR